MTIVPWGKRSAEPQPPRKPRKPGETLHLVGLWLLPLPAAAGFLLSWAGMYSASELYHPGWAATILPGMVDVTILVASIFWVASVLMRRADGGWRLLAHAGVAASVYLNADAGYALYSWAGVPWHVVAPLIWSAFIELLARTMAGRRRAEQGTGDDRLTLRLWLVKPRETFRTWLRMQQTGQLSANLARVEADRCHTAVLALRMKLPAWRHRKMRRHVMGRLAAGSLPPGDVLQAVGWSGAEAGRSGAVGKDDAAGAEAVVIAALSSVLQSAPPRPAPPEAAPPRPIGAAVEAAGADVRPNFGADAGAEFGAASGAVGADSRPASGAAGEAGRHLAPVSPASSGAAGAVGAVALAAPEDIYAGVRPERVHSLVDQALAKIAAAELPVNPSRDAICSAFRVGKKYGTAVQEVLKLRGA